MYIYIYIYIGSYFFLLLTYKWHWNGFLCVGASLRNCAPPRTVVINHPVDTLSEFVSTVDEWLKTWNPGTCPWMKLLIWLRIVHSDMYVWRYELVAVRTRIKMKKQISNVILTGLRVSWWKKFRCRCWCVLTEKSVGHRFKKPVRWRWRRWWWGAADSLRPIAVRSRELQRSHYQWQRWRWWCRNYLG